MNAISRTEKLLTVPDKFRETALSFPSQVEKALAVIDNTDSAQELMARADMLSMYANRIKADAEIMNGIGYGRLLIAAKIGELQPPTPRKETGRGKKLSHAHDRVIPDSTIKKYRKIHKNLPKLEAYREACRQAISKQDQIITIDGFVYFVVGGMRTHKEQKREAKRAEDRQKVAESDTPEDIQGVYSTIVIDPPWDFDDEGDVDQFGRGKPDYATMTIEEIAALPVGERAAKDSHLYLWITNRSLPKGFDLLEAWDFRYITCLTWCKPTIGMGNYFRGSTEQVLFGVRGSLPLQRKNVGTWFSAPRPRKQHSSKPDEFFELVESCSPGPYLEMFSRTKRDGWIHWGSNERT